MNSLDSEQSAHIHVWITAEDRQVRICELISFAIFLLKIKAYQFNFSYYMINHHEGTCIFWHICLQFKIISCICTAWSFPTFDKMLKQISNFRLNHSYFLLIPKNKLYIHIDQGVIFKKITEKYYNLKLAKWHFSAHKQEERVGE